MANHDKDSGAGWLGARFAIPALEEQTSSLVKNSLFNASTPDLQFTHDLPHMAAAGLAAHGLTVNPNTIEVVTDLLYQDTSSELMWLCPKFRNAGDVPYAETSPDDPDLSHLLDRTEIEVFEMHEPFRAQVAAAVAEGIRMHVELPLPLSHTAVLDHARSAIVRGIRDALEDKHPGITNDESHPFWQLETYGLVMMMEEHVKAAKAALEAQRHIGRAIATGRNGPP